MLPYNRLYMLLFVKFYYICFPFCVEGHIHARVHMWRSHDNLVELALSSCGVQGTNSDHQDGEVLYLSHLTSPSYLTF